MFDLEQAVSEWRRRMSAGGIKTPEVLDELESHLREDFEKHVRSGADPAGAFADALQQLGRMHALKAEFAKVDGIVKSGKWERWMAPGISLGVILPLGMYVVLKHEMSLTWRLLGFADIAVVALSVLGCRWINRSFPVIPQKRVRTAFGISCALASLAGMIVFMDFILPHFAFTEGQLTVVVLWALTAMAVLGAVWAGLEEAAKRNADIHGS